MIEPASTAPAPSEPAAKRSNPWKWVVVGLALTTTFTLLGRLPRTPMSAQEFGEVIGSCLSGALYGGALYWLLRGRRATR